VISNSSHIRTVFVIPLIPHFVLVMMHPRREAALPSPFSAAVWLFMV